MFQHAWTTKAALRFHEYTAEIKLGNGDCNFTRQGPGLLGVFAIFLSRRRDSNWASNIQYSATFWYALFMNGSLGGAARCLASSAFRRQVSLSDDIGGGSSNAPNQAASAALVSWSRRAQQTALWQVPARRASHRRAGALRD